MIIICTAFGRHSYVVMLRFASSIVYINIDINSSSFFPFYLTFLEKHSQFFLYIVLIRIFVSDLNSDYFDLNSQLMLPGDLNSP